VACAKVGVLDEVQLLADPTRGWSWTRVLLGLPAEQLHLCGDPAAARLLQRLAAACGDTLHATRYRCGVAVSSGSSSSSSSHGRGRACVVGTLSPPHGHVTLAQT
jgi:ATP-dependent RNA helicase SUPV3L1/SUV3